MAKQKRDPLAPRIALAMFIIQGSLVAAKLTGTPDIPWVAILSPMWVMSIFQMALVFFIWLIIPKKEEDPDE